MILIEQTSVRHSHIYPRQVLGVRMALAGALAFGCASPMVIAETGGYFVDGLEVVTGITPGHRT